jgi:SNF2 family DNA or RNA helicase
MSNAQLNIDGINHNKKRLLELIPPEKIFGFIDFTDRNGDFVPRYLKLIKDDTELLEEIKLYWDENIGWLTDEIFNNIYNDLFQLKCICYFFEYSLDDLQCNNQNCENLVWVRHNIPEQFCSGSCRKASR